MNVSGAVSKVFLNANEANLRKICLTCVICVLLRQRLTPYNLMD
jgi:hypothetical protein